MKRFIILTILSTLISSIIYSQNKEGVGINTTQPQSTLHIDPLGNTNGSTGTTDDIVVGPNGMGIGKLNPTKNLDLSGNALFAGNDTIYGTVNVDNIIVNDTLRLGGDSLDELYSKLDIVAKESGKGFRFDNGSQKFNDKPRLNDMIPVMTLKNDTMSWSNLDAISTIKSRPLLLDTKINNSSDSPVDITSGEMELESGYWLICAGVATSYPNNNGSRSGWYVYLHLRETPYASTNVIEVNGAPSETHSGSAGVATPQLVYLLHVKQKSRYKIFSSTSLGNKGQYPYYTVSKFGNPYFYAIKMN